MRYISMDKFGVRTAVFTFCLAFLMATLAVGRWPLLALAVRTELAGPLTLSMAHDLLAPPSAMAAETEPQVTVLSASQSLTVAPPGATVNIGANFKAVSPLSQNDWIMLYLVDSGGANVAQVENNLNNGLTILPTTKWTGPITITSSMSVPKVENGTYSIMLGLYNSVGPIQLTPGPGIVKDGRGRYKIGSLKIDDAAPPPSFLPSSSLDLTGYNLTFSDNFTNLDISDSMTYDGAKWYTRNEQCCMTTSDGTSTAMVGKATPPYPYSVLPGGGLNIRLQRVQNSWTSGVLTSVDGAGKGFSQQYGYYEMKAKFPTGINTWPAFWMLNTASKKSGAPAGEIDIVEYIANPGFPDYMATTLHDWSRSTTPAMSHNQVTLPTGGFHTYGMLWTATTMTFYFDGAVTFQGPTPSIMQQPYYLLVDLGIGGGWPTRSTPYQNNMQIQYIHVYSK